MKGLIRIALKNQVHIYSVDTSAFYTDVEHEIDKKIIAARVANDQKSVKLYKEQLRQAFSEFSGIRSVRPEYINPRNIISIFESSLTRTLKLKTDELTDALVIVRVYFFEVFRDIVLNGFYMSGEKYVVLTASAGQIRTKKCVFIKESLLEKHRDTIMCGLTIDHINEKGGCNTNKFLAYLALVNSATDEWTEFDIDRSIVVDDMEFPVRGVVDHIDSLTYKITRKEMDVVITHTDGAGMVLPELSGGKNFMVRLPFVKGMLGSFAFDEWCREHGHNGDVWDIYGKRWNIFDDRIQVIFTKSQFKMWKYYDSWNDYKTKYKKHGCTAGICNVEEDQIYNATLNYQMLQSLTDITTDELKKLAATTKYKLEKICSDKKTMLKCLGAREGNPNMTYLRQALLLYPELLQDVHCREELRNLKKSLQKWAWGGKIDIYGKYLFAIPDLYAFCQWLFLGDKNPEGLLADGEVYAALFPDSEKLDCLRSPSLYREHPVRINKVNDERCKRWFSKRGIYVSCHDLISKIVQMDWDGDKLLVCADKTLIQVAERNMQDIVPLYYDMRTAPAHQLSNEAIYEGMKNAYTSGSIGPTSNMITKIWNSEKCDLDVIKWLCYQTNERID